jgi:hypothetical protein
MNFSGKSDFFFKKVGKSKPSERQFAALRFNGVQFQNWVVQTFNYFVVLRCAPLDIFRAKPQSTAKNAKYGLAFFATTLRLCVKQNPYFAQSRRVPLSTQSLVWRSLRLLCGFV